jgi:hypothetical protein
MKKVNLGIAAMFATVSALALFLGETALRAAEGHADAAAPAAEAKMEMKEAAPAADDKKAEAPKKHKAKKKKGAKDHAEPAADHAHEGHG